MSGNRKSTTNERLANSSGNKVVHIYQHRPEMALEHIQRTTGLEFESLPESLVNKELNPATTRKEKTVKKEKVEPQPPILTDIVRR